MTNEIACIFTGEKSDLLMHAHRNEAGDIVGWIFASQKCSKELENIKLDYTINPVLDAKPETVNPEVQGKSDRLNKDCKCPDAGHDYESARRPDAIQELMRLQEKIFDIIDGTDFSNEVMQAIEDHIADLNPHIDLNEKLPEIDLNALDGRLTAVEEWYVNNPDDLNLPIYLAAKIYLKERKGQ